ncbi:MAG: phosphatidylglycerophosphatase A [Thiotrichales bacterium]|nr:phosphatidylglycerophosphatase A [Thiotrichales bacterium]
MLHWIAFGAGAGLAPRAPGTVGTIVAVPIYLAVGTAPVVVYTLVTAFVISVGIRICGRTARDLGVHDHPGIVLDEIAGFLVTMTALPFEWPWIVAGFIAFRVFDIAKPWPVSLADRRVGGGLGIMLDDVIAGTLACAALHAVRYAFGL